MSQDGLTEYKKYVTLGGLGPKDLNAFFKAEVPVEKRKRRKETVFNFRDQEEIDSVLDVAAIIKKKRKNSPPRVLLMRTLYESMARVSELTSLEVRDLEMFRYKKKTYSTILIRQGKGGKQRRVPVSDLLYEDLREYLGGRKTGPLFLSSWGRKYTRQYVGRICQEVSQQFEFDPPLTPHIFRHSMATFLLNEGKVGIEHLQSLLGHASIATTTIYAKSLPLAAFDAYKEAIPH